MISIDVSVIIPTFHRERQLLEAIGSVLSQQAVTLEVIVVDDSAEGSARSAVASVRDSRVQYSLRTEPSGGRPARVRNDGAKMARGRYVYFLDDDDRLEPGALAAMSAALSAKPRAGMAFGVVVPFGNNPAKLAHNRQYFSECRRRAARLRSRDSLSAILVFNPTVLVNSACMGRRDRFNAIGGFDADIPICEDADLWSRMADGAGFVFLDRPVVNYRTGESSLMHDLAENDDKLHVSYRLMQDKYRRSHGGMRSLATKLWARAVLR